MKNQILYFVNFIFLLLTIFFNSFCSSKQEERVGNEIVKKENLNSEPFKDSKKSERIQNDSTIKDKTFELRVFKIDSLNGYGYDIFIDGNKYVHQPTIPAVSGNLPFSTQLAAQKTGELCLKKIKENILPPTITTEELRKIGVIN